MSGKKFKILNSKINFLLQVTTDTGGKHYVTGVKVEYMTNAQESCLRDLNEGIENKQAEIMAFHSKIYDSEVQQLRDVAQERHALLMEKVIATKLSLVDKVTEMKSLLSYEVKKV
ncbi:unnamed protein product [Lactuca virosa]|uniref:Uncharacterized protein n=1 Tax=Lactuca virosa TaxID=75947 RepID=A0AAU9PRQ6_9ASTR|nr:unnamed protein product [Lactuca virosa]